jgi:hypothetical protein
MPDHEVTLGEVYRAIVEVRQEQRDMRKDLIGRAEYESDQEGIDRRFEESAKVHTQLETRVAEVNAARKVAVTEEATEREKADSRIEARLDRIGATVKWGGGTVITVILTVVGWIIASGGGPR